MEIVFMFIGLVCGGLISFFYNKSVQKKDYHDRDSLLESANQNAENTLLKAEVENQEKLDSMRITFEESCISKNDEIKQGYNKIEAKEALINSKLEIVEKKENDLDIKKSELRKFEKEIDEEKKEYRVQLEKLHRDIESIAAMSHEQAREYLLSSLREELQQERSELLNSSNNVVDETVEKRGRTLLLEVMQRYAAECSSDKTTTTIHLPNDEIKGRIIGREGRNIRTLEALTGADILIDDTPETVVVSCFEPLRREIAKKAIEKLVEDGRIQPDSIHHAVLSARDQLDKEMFNSAEDIVQELNIPDISSKIITQMGKLKFRFNQNQNLLQQSREIAAFMGILSAELNLDVPFAKKIGFLCNIGKSFDEFIDDDSIGTGVQFLKRYDEDKDIIKAIESLNKQKNLKNSEYDIMLDIAINLSIHRPGARQETMEFYIRRLHNIEVAVNEYEEVEECHVMQAGREICIFVAPEKITDDNIALFTRDIAGKLKDKFSFPGPVNVSVIKKQTVTEKI